MQSHDCLFTKEMFEEGKGFVQKSKDDKDIIELRLARIEAAEETFNIVTNELLNKLNETWATTNLAQWKSEKKADIKSDPVIRVHQGDWSDVTAELTKKHGEIFAVLNEVDAHIPGGGWLEGRDTPEAMMFTQTNICLSITNKVASINRIPIYNLSDRVLLSKNPQVCFRRAAESYDLLATNIVFPFYELRSPTVTCKKELREQETRKNIMAQLTTLKNRGIRHVVLGAFSCGMPGYLPKQVARLYREALQSLQFLDAFDEVHFAIDSTRYHDRIYQGFFDELNGQKLFRNDFLREAKSILDKKIKLTPEMVKALYKKITPEDANFYSAATIDNKVVTFNHELIQLIIDLKLAKNKQEKNTVLKNRLIGCNDVHKINDLFVLLREIEDLNHQRHSTWDCIRFFSRQPINTKTWRNTMDTIRQHALLLLQQKQMNPDVTLDEQRELFEWARKAAIFTKHRNNSIFAGACGDTKTVGKIKNMLSGMRRG